jgi:hypothetical protein
VLVGCSPSAREAGLTLQVSFRRCLRPTWHLQQSGRSWQLRCAQFAASSVEPSSLISASNLSRVPSDPSPNRSLWKDPCSPRLASLPSPLISPPWTLDPVSLAWQDRTHQDHPRWRCRLGRRAYTGAHRSVPLRDKKLRIQRIGVGRALAE